MADSFNEGNFISLCNKLARKDHCFKAIIKAYGYPPIWKRNPSFETLIHIILEQQVSLASAKAAYDKLKATVGTISPEAILGMSDETFKSCYFSRQKTIYARCLAKSIVDGDLDIDILNQQDATTIRTELKKIKGIGDWTVDVYLMICLHHTDLFPLGDIALINSIKHIKELSSNTTKDEIAELTVKWAPYRTIAAYLLWHAYICRKGVVF